MLAASDAPPSTEEIAQFNIILFSSIFLVIICYFSMMAMVNMVRVTPPLYTASASVSCASLALPLWFPLLHARSGRDTHRSPSGFPCACLALQDVGSDSLLYSKSKSD